MTSEDIYSDESEKKRTFSTFKNRLNLWNFCEKFLNKKYIAKTVADTGVNIESTEEMIKFIILNNQRMEDIRKHVKYAGTELEKRTLGPLLVRIN